MNPYTTALSTLRDLVSEDITDTLAIVPTPGNSVDYSVSFNLLGSRSTLTNGGLEKLPSGGMLLSSFQRSTFGKQTFADLDPIGGNLDLFFSEYIDLLERVHIRTQSIVSGDHAKILTELARYVHEHPEDSIRAEAPYSLVSWIGEPVTIGYHVQGTSRPPIKAILRSQLHAIGEQFSVTLTIRSGRDIDDK